MIVLAWLKRPALAFGLGALRHGPIEVMEPGVGTVLLRHRTQVVRALASHPLVLAVRKAQAIYAELAAVHRDHLPERLLN